MTDLTAADFQAAPNTSDKSMAYSASDFTNPEPNSDYLPDVPAPQLQQNSDSYWKDIAKNAYSGVLSVLSSTEQKLNTVFNGDSKSTYWEQKAKAEQDSINEREAALARAGQGRTLAESAGLWLASNAANIGVGAVVGGLAGSAVKAIGAGITGAAEGLSGAVGSAVSTAGKATSMSAIPVSGAASTLPMEGDTTTNALLGAAGGVALGAAANLGKEAYTTASKILGNSSSIGNLSNKLSSAVSDTFGGLTAEAKDASQKAVRSSVTESLDSWKDVATQVTADLYQATNRQIIKPDVVNQLLTDRPELKSMWNDFLYTNKSDSTPFSVKQLGEFKSYLYKQLNNTNPNTSEFASSNDALKTYIGKLNMFLESSSPEYATANSAFRNVMQHATSEVFDRNSSTIGTTFADTISKLPDSQLGTVIQKLSANGYEKQATSIINNLGQKNPDALLNLTKQHVSNMIDTTIPNGFTDQAADLYKIFGSNKNVRTMKLFLPEGVPQLQPYRQAIDDLQKVVGKIYNSEHDASGLKLSHGYAGKVSNFLRTLQGRDTVSEIITSPEYGRILATAAKSSGDELVKNINTLNNHLILKNYAAPATISTAGSVLDVNQ